MDPVPLCALATEKGGYTTGSLSIVGCGVYELRSLSGPIGLWNLLSVASTSILQGEEKFENYAFVEIDELTPMSISRFWLSGLGGFQPKI